jgi:tetratricopeptide (TPR) repeat protein
MNQYQKAIEIWEQYLLYDNKNVTVLTRIADSYRKVKKFTNSKNAYNRVLEIEESNAYAIIGLGHLYYDFKEYKESLFYLEKMLEFGFDNADIRVLTSVGNCHRKLKTFSEGIPFFEAALRRDNNNFYALFGLVDCYRGMNRTENVIEYCSRILEFDPKNKMILTRIGDAYRNLKEFDMAKKYYQKAINIDFDTYAIMGIALISKVQEKYDEAISSLKKLIQQDPRNYRIYSELSDCYLKNGENVKAAEILEDFKKLGKKSV